jgi:hypothetical protein
MTVDLEEIWTEVNVAYSKSYPGSFLEKSVRIDCSSAEIQTENHLNINLRVSPLDNLQNLVLLKYELRCSIRISLTKALIS